MSTTVNKESLAARIEKLELNAAVFCTSLNEEFQLEAYKMLLATMEAEPVAWDYEWASCITCEGPQDFKRIIERDAPPEWAIEEGQARSIIPLYRHAQPAPVVPDDGRADFEAWVLEVHDGDISKAQLPEGEDYANAHTRCVWKAWKACRAAMLQELQKSAGVSNNCRTCENVQDLQAGNSPAQGGSRCSIKAAPALDSSPKTAESRCGNSPVIPDRWIPVSERMPENKPGCYEYLVFETLNNRVNHDYWNVPDKGDDAFTPFWNYYSEHVTHWMPLPYAPEK